MLRSTCVSHLRGFFLLMFLAMYLGVFAQTTAYYHLITGSFAKLEEAKSMVSELKSQGYNPVLLFPSGDNKYYRVSLYQSFDRDEVQKYAAAQKAKKKPSGWVLAMEDPKAPANTAVPSTANARLAAPAKTATEAAKTGEATDYHLIIGSFDDFDSADKLVMALAQQGYEPYVIFPEAEGEKFRVSVYHADNRKEMEAYAAMLKKRGKEKGWIYEETKASPNTLAGARMASRGGSDLAAFHLIGGSFQRYEQALAYAEEMKAAGHSPLVLFPQATQSDRFRVSIYQSDNQKEVAKYRKDLEKNGKPAGWIYAKK